MHYIFNTSSIQFTFDHVKYGRIYLIVVYILYKLEWTPFDLADIEWIHVVHFHIAHTAFHIIYVCVNTVKTNRSQ